MKGYYKQLIVDRIDKQIDKGLNKYGMTLEDNQSLKTPERLDHLAEELVDGLQYIEHLKVAHGKNERHKKDIIDSVGSLIFLTSALQDGEIKEGMIKEIKAINDSVKGML